MSIIVNKIKITNLPDLYTYSNGEDSELYISKVHDSENPIFLDDEYIIINDDILISYTNESANEIEGFFYKNGKLEKSFTGFMTKSELEAIIIWNMFWIWSKHIVRKSFDIFTDTPEL